MSNLISSSIFMGTLSLPLFHQLNLKHKCTLHSI